MADRKRKRRVGFAPTVCGPVRCRLLISLPRMESRLRRVQPTRPSYPRSLIRGMRSIKEPEQWTCGACGFENEPIHHLLFDLPPFHCKSCNADPPEGSVDFGFRYDDLARNGYCPISNVKDREGSTCMANALTSALEITHRIMKIVREEPVNDGPVLDVDDLLDKYVKRCGKVAEPGGFRLEALFTMFDVLKYDGVKDMEGKKLYKIHDWASIDKHDFAALSSALADGYPLLMGFKTGKRIFDLQPGEVYMPPELRSGGHIALLVGAQLEQKNRFFYFLSSWGEEFCLRMYEGDGIVGGVGAIWADGIDFAPIQLLRFGERRKDVVKHPEYRSLKKQLVKKQ